MTEEQRKGEKEMQIFLDDEEYTAIVEWLMDSFEIDLTQAREYADDLLNTLDIGKLEEGEEENAQKE